MVAKIQYYVSYTYNNKRCTTRNFLEKSKAEEIAEVLKATDPAVKDVEVNEIRYSAY